MESKLMKIINQILSKTEKKRERYSQFDPNTSLRNDLHFDSLDLAEFTVRVEDEFGVDIFEEGIVDKLSEVMEKLNGESKP